MEYVYFIRHKGDDTSPIKVGYTTVSIRDRLRSLQGGSPFPLECIEFIRCFHAGEGAMVEKQLHQLLQHRRLTGEWFRIDRSEILALATAALIALGGEEVIQYDHAEEIP